MLSCDSFHINVIPLPVEVRLLGPRVMPPAEGLPPDVGQALGVSERDNPEGRSDAELLAIAVPHQQAPRRPATDDLSGSLPQVLCPVFTRHQQPNVISCQRP